MKHDIYTDSMFNEEVQNNLIGVLSELNAIRQIINKDHFSSANPYLINYSIVRSSGTLEQSYKTLIYDFLRVEEKEKLNVYLKKFIVDSSSNPNTGNITKMLEGMDGMWSNKFNENINLISKEGEHKANLNSLVQSRNDFAHGVNLSSIKMETVIKNYESGIYILKVLDCILNEIEMDI